MPARDNGSLFGALQLIYLFSGSAFVRPRLYLHPSLIRLFALSLDIRAHATFITLISGRRDTKSSIVARVFTSVLNGLQGREFLKVPHRHVSREPGENRGREDVCTCRKVQDNAKIRAVSGSPQTGEIRWGSRGGIVNAVARELRGAICARRRWERKR